ncbi:MAG TPA: ABC transporter ATP-binding protein [Longimicrobiaceae bacterium]|nr:ABC transporter ATP-binding protein [Longimicrobiaceae bacterium]
MTIEPLCERPGLRQPSTLEVAGLTKRYLRGALPAVEGVTTAVSPGEIVAVIGESGCGKTTLLRLIAGLEVPDAGEVRIRGIPVAGAGSWIAPEHRGVGLVFQEFALFPHMTVTANVVYGLGGMPRRQRRSRADAMLELVGLRDYGDRYPHQLSGGQQQRIALARALAPEPHLLLLDEPFSNLDTALKRALRDELLGILRGTGITTMLVVHDAEDVLALADRALVMRRGRVVQEGDPDTLYRRPADEYVARFFGDTNVLEGRPAAGGFETVVGLVACTEATTGNGPVRLCIRPEDLRLVAGEAHGKPGIVRRIRPAGARRQVIIALENGGSASTLAVTIGHELPMSEGDRVFVAPAGECAHVLGTMDAR